jgi:PAS domain-containing protein
LLVDPILAAVIAREYRLYLAEIFRANPLLALALLICLATILWCILLTRRQRNGLDKVLTGLLGLIAIYESLRILKDSGFAMFAHFHMLEGWVDFISACLYLLAALILKASSLDRATTKVHLRLVEAGEKPMDLACAMTAAVPELGHPLVDSSPLAIFAIDQHGTVTYLNLAAELLTGWTRSELVGHHLPFDLRGSIEGKNGRPIACAVWTAPIRAPHGPPRGKVIIAAGSSALRNAGLTLPASSATPPIAARR